nr:uncharacterized protein LOC111837369 [Paramormyrops kingsleyae]
MNLLLLLALFFTAVAAGPFPPRKGQPGGPPFGGQQMGGSMDTGRPMGGSMDTGRPMGGSMNSGRPMGGSMNSDRPMGGSMDSGRPMGGSMDSGRPMGGSMDSDRPMGGSVNPGRPMEESMGTDRPMGELSNPARPVGTGERKPHLPGKEQRPPRSQEYLRLGPWGENMGGEGADPQEYWRHPMQGRNSRQPTNWVPVNNMQASAQRGPPNKPPGAHEGLRPGGPMPGHPDMRNPSSTDGQKFFPIIQANNVTLQNASLYHFKEGENMFLLPKIQAGVPQPKGGANAPQEMGYGYGLYGLQPYLKVYFSSSSPQTVSYEYGILSPVSKAALVSKFW